MTIPISLARSGLVLHFGFEYCELPFKFTTVFAFLLAFLNLLYIRCQVFLTKFVADLSFVAAGKAFRFFSHEEQSRFWHAAENDLHYHRILSSPLGIFFESIFDIHVWLSWLSVIVLILPKQGTGERYPIFEIRIMTICYYPTTSLISWKIHVNNKSRTFWFIHANLPPSFLSWLSVYTSLINDTLPEQFIELAWTWNYKA